MSANPLFLVALSRKWSGCLCRMYGIQQKNGLAVSVLFYFFKLFNQLLWFLFTEFMRDSIRHWVRQPLTVRMWRSTAVSWQSFSQRKPKESRWYDRELVHQARCSGSIFGSAAITIFIPMWKNQASSMITGIDQILIFRNYFCFLWQWKLFGIMQTLVLEWEIMKIIVID